MKKTYVTIFTAIFIFASTLTVASTEKLSANKKAAYDTVIKALSYNHPRIRANAIEVIAASNNNELMKQVEKMLNDKSLLVRFAAAMAIGETRYYPAKNKMESLSHAPDKNMALAASYALVKLGKTEKIQKIVDALHDSDETVIANAAMIAGRLKYTPAIPRLNEIKNNPDASDTVAFNATEALAKLDDKKIYEKIWTMLISIFPDDRFMGINAMAALGSQQAAGAIYTMLDDPIPEIRLTAAEKLGSLGDKSGEMVIIDFLTEQNDPNATKMDYDRRKAIAAMGIGTIKTQKLATFLPDMLKSDSLTVRLAAAKAVFLIEK